MELTQLHGVLQHHQTMLDRMHRDAEDYRRLADAAMEGNMAEAREMRREILRRQQEDAKTGDKRRLEDVESAAPPRKQQKKTKKNFLGSTR